MKQKNLYLTAVWLLLIESFLIFAPLYILGKTLNWPASLDEPASVNLPLILEQYAGMMTGYSIYLVYSILFWPMAYFTGRVFAEDDSNNVWFKMGCGFAVASIIARSLGIVRWMFGMPVLAKLYINGSPQLKESISMVYDMLNAYMGGVGEMLGVSLFAVLWLVFTSVMIIQSEKWPSWLGYFGFVAGIALMMNTLEAVGINLGAFISVTVAVFHFWMWAAAFVIFRKMKKNI